MSDYIFLLESRLSPDQLQLLVQVQQAATAANVRLFLAGGAVRDLLGGFPVRDLDFAAEGPALKLVRQLDKRLFTVRSVDDVRQSAEVVFGSQATAEVALCRREFYAKAGGKPEVKPATIQDDLRRRDFSVNAVALSLNPASRGLLIDPTNGLADLERKELRALSNTSFYDDPSRMLRLIRLQVRLKYSVEEKTRQQFENAREAGLAEQIPPRARWRELQQLAAEPEGAETVKALASEGLLGVFEPHLGKKHELPMIARLDKVRRAAEKSGARMDSFGPFLWALTHKLSAAERNGLRKRVGMKTAEAKPWTDLEAQARALQKALAGKSQNSRAHEALRGADPAVALFLMAFSPMPGVRERVKSYFAQMAPAAEARADGAGQ
jgi:tRNA nucleotidyltransferase/poly(A) polymerase